MYLIARPSVPPLYPPLAPLSLSFWERKKRRSRRWWWWRRRCSPSWQLRPVKICDRWGRVTKLTASGEIHPPELSTGCPDLPDQRDVEGGVCVSVRVCMCVCWAPKMCRGSWGSLAACHGWHRAHLPQTCGALNHLLPPYTDTHTHTPPSLNARASLRPPQEKKMKHRYTQTLWWLHMSSALHTFKCTGSLTLKLTHTHKRKL